MILNESPDLCERKIILQPPLTIFQQDTEEYLNHGGPKSQFSRSQRGGDEGGGEEEKMGRRGYRA